jgi:hypothetical protein
MELLTCLSGLQAAYRAPPPSNVSHSRSIQLKKLHLKNSRAQRQNPRSGTATRTTHLQ